MTNANDRLFWRVYILPEPGTNDVRYVGITSTPLDVRLASHKRERKNKEKFTWLRQLAARGLKPEPQQIDSLYGTLREAEARENRYIRLYLIEGADLCNIKGIVGDRECYREFLRRTYHEPTAEKTATRGLPAHEQ